MLKIERLLIAGILIFIGLSSSAQNNTNSPYTRFGYGELADRSFGAGRAMGGVGVGLRSPKQINPMNPASYSCMDSLTFIFDFGISGQLSWYDDGINTQKNINGNVEYIALQFPVHRRVALSVGLLPYSYVGYSYGAQRSTEGGYNYGETYTGTGGLQDLYLGVAVDVWKKRLSVGANVGYFFGTITHEQSSIVGSSTEYNTVRGQELDVRDMKLDFGIQYTHPIGKYEDLVFGFTFSPKNRLHSTMVNMSYKATTNGTTEVLTSDTTKNAAYDLPNSFGFGASYVKRNKLTLAADVLYETWSKAYFEGEKNTFKDRVRVALGGEYIPNIQKHNYFNRVRYRLGAHYSDYYLKINNTGDATYKGNGYKECGVSLGFGLPLIDNRSLVNVSLEYNKIIPSGTNMVDEQYFRFTVNYTFNEMWFWKKKVD
jgi:hypothetical protein